MVLGDPSERTNLTPKGVMRNTDLKQRKSQGVLKLFKSTSSWEMTTKLGGYPTKLQNYKKQALVPCFALFHSCNFQLPSLLAS